MAGKYQHVRPQRELDHEVKRDLTKRTRVCADCGKPVYLVPDNEGPETLKSFFVLR